jgi:hypothetical protein
MRHGFFPDSMIATRYTDSDSILRKDIWRYEYDAPGDLISSTISDYYVDTVLYKREYTFVDGDPVKIIDYALPKGFAPIRTNTNHFDTSHLNTIRDPYPWPVVINGKHLSTGFEINYDWGTGPNTAYEFEYTFDSLGRVHQRIQMGSNAVVTFGYY